MGRPEVTALGSRTRYAPLAKTKARYVDHGIQASSLKMLLLVVILWATWETFAPWVAPNLDNPFAPLLFISHRVPDSPQEDPRYQKGWFDLVFVAYYIIFWSFVRQTITISICRPVGQWFGIKKEAKLDRFGEQGYAILYWGAMGCWGLVRRRVATNPKPKCQRLLSSASCPSCLHGGTGRNISGSVCIISAHMSVSPTVPPTDYPHWDMKPELKRYYLMQAAYWCQQFIILILGLEKPRKDYNELVTHHIVTLWLIG